MKILILVLSSKKEPFFSLMKKQQQTWDSIYYPNVETIYYYGDNVENTIEISKWAHELILNTSDEYKMMHWKFFLTLEKIINRDWDFVFRTNSSSYIDKANLLEFANRLPKNGCYCGVEIENYASGAGFFISKDVVNILLSSNFTNNEIEWEDKYIGKILYENKVKFSSESMRFDVNDNNINEINNSNHYHYRCKSENDNRNIDSIRFDKIFKIKNKL